MVKSRYNKSMQGKAGYGESYVEKSSLLIAVTVRRWTVGRTVVTVLIAPPLHPPHSPVEPRADTQPLPPSDHGVSSLNSILQSSNVLHFVLHSVVEDLVGTGTSLLFLYRDISTGTECFLRSTA